MNELRDHRREAGRGTTARISHARMNERGLSSSIRAVNGPGRVRDSQSNRETGSEHSGPCGAAFDFFLMRVAGGTGFAFFRDRCSESHGVPRLGSDPPGSGPSPLRRGPSSLGAPAHPTPATDDRQPPTCQRPDPRIPLHGNRGLDRSRDRNTSEFQSHGALQRAAGGRPTLQMGAMDGARSAMPRLSACAGRGISECACQRRFMMKGASTGPSGIPNRPTHTPFETLVVSTRLEQCWRLGGVRVLGASIVSGV